jgi:hypothetical protein
VTKSKIKNGWKRNWPVFIKSLISIRWTGWHPQLRLIEKYEPIVKWPLRILALLSIISSIFIFPSPFEALGFAIVVLLIQQFFEKSVFVYTTMYVQPMPEFEVEKKEWTAMGYAFPDPPAPDRPNLMGPAFASADMRRKYSISSAHGTTMQRKTKTETSASHSSSKETGTTRSTSRQRPLDRRPNHSFNAATL